MGTLWLLVTLVTVQPGGPVEEDYTFFQAEAACIQAAAQTGGECIETTEEDH